MSTVSIRLDQDLVNKAAIYLHQACTGTYFICRCFAIKNSANTNNINVFAQQLPQFVHIGQCGSVDDRASQTSVRQWQKGSFHFDVNDQTMSNSVDARDKGQFLK